MSNVKPEDVRWGTYRDREGAWHPGVYKLKLPSNPTPGHILLDIVTQTEGGSGSAANFYDRCLCSLGYLQWCQEKYRLTSKMLAAIAEGNPSLLHPLKPALEASDVEFRKGPQGWDFYTKRSGELVDGPDQIRMFYLNASGLKGSWDTASKEHVKLWCASAVNTLAQPEADAIQIEFTAQRMYNFAMPESRTILFSEGKPLAGWPGAVQAAFLSYAANLPAVADRHLKIAVERSTAAKWSEAWCLDVIKELAFGPGISIYPHRYDKIRPRLEFHFGVDLPDCSDELKAWRGSQGGDNRFETVEEIQQFLLSQGYDLGPWGADGVLGKATVAAIQEFQKRHGLVADGIVGRQTRAKMVAYLR